MSEFEKNQSEKFPENTESDQSANPTSQDGNGRRKFLKGAAAATPVLLTVASRPVWARNCTLSGQLSGNLSDQSGDTCTGEGCTPGYWHNQGMVAQRWSAAFPPHMTFTQAFGTNVFGHKTLLEVVNPENKLKADDINLPSGCSIIGDHKKNENPCVNIVRQLGFHCVAALQNAATSIKYDLTVEQVLTMCREALDGGTATSMEQTKDALASLNEQYCPY